MKFASYSNAFPKEDRKQLKQGIIAASAPFNATHPDSFFFLLKKPKKAFTF